MPSQYDVHDDPPLVTAAWALAVAAIGASLRQRLLLRSGDTHTTETLLRAAARSFEGRCLVERVMFGYGLPPGLWWAAPDRSFDATPRDYAPTRNPLDRLYGWEIDPTGRLVRKQPPSRRASA